MNTLTRITAFTIILLMSYISIASPPQSGTEDKLPVDPSITIGQLDNGLKYYIRYNQKPETRAELRLVLNAGSILENDDQLGLAHFVEHMAFNGTKSFEKQELVDYLESVGMRFGPDLNAYTSFDETVYMLQIATDSTEQMKKAFKILREWANFVAFEDEEIDKERGVVIEEWRLGRGAGMRMLDKQLPILLKNSRYAERLPIGKKELLESFPHQTARDFYRDWYRPDLMAVVAVGDFDKANIEALIKENFSDLTSVENPREREYFPVPDHEETLYAIASDPEATNNSISIYFKRDKGEQGSAASYRKSIVEALYSGMLNSRLDELRQQSDPPFLGAYAGGSDFLRTKGFYVLGAGVNDNGLERGLEALLTEAARVRRFGFTQTELDRQKTEMLRGMEQTFAEKDKTPSRRYAAEYIRNFLENEPIPGIEYELGLYKKFLPEISLAEVNALSEKLIREKNRVIMVSMPEKEDLRVPTEADLQAVFETASQKTITAYEDAVSDEPLISELPEPGKIADEKKNDALGVTEWKLSNGARVVLKPTDFKNDQVLMSAYSPGGTSLVEDKDYVPAMTASMIIGASGVGNFNQIELTKKLAGKVVNVRPSVGSLEEGFSGSASPQDAETMFQLIHLYFTSPRKDTTAFQSIQTRLQGFIANRGADPGSVFQDTISTTLAQGHYRARPWSEAVLKEMDLERSYAIYKDRFADAGDFVFYFVGNVDLEKFRGYTENYLANLPATSREENWRDVGIEEPQGVVKKYVRKGLEEKSQVRIMYHGDFKWNRQNRYDLNAMTHALRIKLREVLREDKGGTYGVGVWSSPSHYPDEEYMLTISFGCAPDRVSELTASVFEQVDSLKNVGTTEKYLQKIKEIQRRQDETNLKENSHWMRTLAFYNEHGEDPMNILELEKYIKGLNLEVIQKAAQQYFDEKNMIQVILYPENFEL